MQAHPPTPLFLGLDLSTQQLKAVLVSQDSQTVHSAAVNFDDELAHFGTVYGSHSAPASGEVTSPVRMWLEAVDLLLGKMKAAGVDFGAIAAVSGAGQQHGSVYWSSEAEGILSSLDPAQSLAPQMSPAAFSLPDAPIWKDCSTSLECRALEDVVGGQQQLADLTGSRAYERFTGPQIAKIRRAHPNAYERTARISLVSSFVCSLFLGHIAPIDVADASGMNLMNILTCKWDDRLLAACGGPELRAKLGTEPVLAGVVLGKVCNWWVQRWGFSPDCSVAPFTGDNPATMVPFSNAGDAILSLGTSTTLLLSIPPAETPPQRFTTSHLLSHPTTPGSHIAMLCYMNGAAAREQIRDRYAGGKWSGFNELVQATPPGCNGYFGLYFPWQEIIPPNVRGCFFFLKQDGRPVQPIPITDMPENAHPRAILESQFLSIRSRIKAIWPPNTPSTGRLIVTGGASSNPRVLQVAADVFGMSVFVVDDSTEAAATGGALLARYAWWRRERQSGSLDEMMSSMRMHGIVRGNIRTAAEPQDESLAQLYEKLVGNYVDCEGHVVQMRLSADPNV